jgi:hypothetical protein
MLPPSVFRRAAASAAVVAFAAGLGGCSVYQTDISGSFSEAALTTPGAAAGIPVQVDGKVGGVQGAPLATAVAAAMPTTVADAAVHYAPCAAYTECAGDHVVWTFGPPAARPTSAYPPFAAYNLNWLWGYQPAPNNVTVKVAVFQGGQVVSSASGQVDADNPGDPAFQALIADMSQAVLSSPGWFNDVL